MGIFGLILILIGVALVFALGGLTMSVLYTAISGLIVGALGRLVLPGREKIGWLGTILIGIGGSTIGGVIGRAIGLGQLLQLVLSVAAAAVLLTVLGFRAD